MKDKTFKITFQSLWYFFTATAFSVICVGGYNPYFMKLRNLLFAGIVCCTCIVVVMVRKKITLDLSFLLFLFVGIYMIFSAAFSLDMHTGFKIAGYYIIGSIVLMIEYRERMIDWIINSMKLLVLIIAVSILISVPIDDCMNRYFSWLINPSHNQEVAQSIRDAVTYSHSYTGFAKEKSVAAYIMGMGICIYLGKYFSGEALQLREKIGFLFETAALLFTAKRMIPVCLLMVFIILMFTSKLNAKLTRLLLFTVGGLLLLVTALWLVPEMHHVFARFTNAASDILTGRRELWDLSLQMFSEAPLFGKGLGAFNEFAARQGYLDTSGARWNYYGHNCYYEFLGELGMVGFVLVFGSIFYMLVKTFLLSRNEALSRKQRVHIYTALAIELMLLIYCISGNVLLYADQTLALFFSFAVVRSVMIQNINLEEKAENRRFYAE